MRVALIHMRHAHTGGTERYLNHLASWLAERDHEVTIVCRRHEAPPHPAVRFHILHPFALGGAWRMRAFAQAVDEHIGTAGYDIAFGLGKTFTHDVIRLGGGLHETYLERAHAATLTSLERRLNWGAAKHRTALEIERRALAPGAYRRVIVNASMVADDAAARYDVPRDQIDVIYNGVDLERFHPRLRAEQGAELRLALGFEANDFVILFLGTGYGRKGLDQVLEACPEVFAKESRARLVVVGYDSAIDTWMARAATLGLADRARFLGGRRDPEVCFAASDLYVLPTRYDPFANSTLEALASGLPVLTTSGNGASELITANVDGNVLSTDAAPEELSQQVLAWSDPTGRRTGSDAARALAEAHPIASKMEASASVLEEVASSRLRH